MSGRRFRAAAVAGILLAATLPAAAAIGEVVQGDGVRVAVTGALSPIKLPRSGTAPVAVSVAGRITPMGPEALPKLERISIAINRNGKLRNRDVPVCRLGRIEPSTSAQALAACRSSLVGEGTFSASVKIPEQSPFPSQGKVLAFNGKLNGKPAILAHIYGIDPVPTSYVLPFLIEPSRGTYGTTLEASLPSVTGEWGYVTGVSLDLDSSYLAAGCPAPAGFPGVNFPLMKTSFGFGAGLNLTSILFRRCQVR